MNPAMDRFDRKEAFRRILLRAGTIAVVAVFVIITLILMDAGIQDARLNG